MFLTHCKERSPFALIYFAHVEPGDHEVTELLRQWGQGDQSAFHRLIPIVYRELRKIAKQHMRKQDAYPSLQTTAVVHEAYLKLLGSSQKDWGSRAHFFAVASKAMRHFMVSHARERQALKRGGEIRNLPLDLDFAIPAGIERDAIALDDALTSLAAFDARKVQVVELRYFAGLSVEETAKALGISAETVGREWRFAKSYLKAEIARSR
jgi:RNA polymerase sigma-70 factor (ECF subfamily)